MLNSSNTEITQANILGSSESPEHEISPRGRKQQFLCHRLWLLFFGTSLCPLLCQWIQGHLAPSQLLLRLSCADPHPLNTQYKQIKKSLIKQFTFGFLWAEGEKVSVKDYQRADVEKHKSLVIMFSNRTNRTRKTSCWKPDTWGWGKINSESLFIYSAPKPPSPLETYVQTNTRMINKIFQVCSG